MKKKWNCFPARGKCLKYLLAMKLIAAMFFASILQLTASVYSQTARVNLELKDVSLQEVIWKIREQTEFEFFYSLDDVTDIEGLTVNLQDAQVEEVLEKCLQGTGLTFKIRHKNIVLKKAPPKPIKSAEADLEAEQKFIVIQGEVVDDQGNPLPYASVVIKGTTFGAPTTDKGVFRIEAPEANYKALVVSSIGYLTKEVPISGSDYYTIELKLAVGGIEEVVITGYTKGSKVTQSSSSTKVVAADIERQVTVDLVDRMEGLSTGLNLNAVTRDGGQEKIELILRGISTFDEEGELYDMAMQDRNSLNRQPLIVVDGFPYEGPFNDIDQATIESIDVLKDAAATALWGLRASNGVIVITTKRGAAGKPKVFVSSNWIFGTKQNLSDMGFASAADMIHLKNEGMQYLSSYNNLAYNVVNYVSPTWVYDPVLGWQQVIQENLSYKYAAVDAFENIWAQFYEGSISETERDQRLATLGQNNVLGQFEDNLLRNGFSSQNTVSIRGGSIYSNYNLTVSHTQEKSPAIGDNFERLNVSLTNDFNLTDKWGAQVDFALVTSENKNNGIGVSNLYTSTSGVINMYDQLVDGQGNPLNIISMYGDREAEFLARGFDPNGYSPITEMEMNDNQNKSLNIRIAGGTNYDITDWLNLDVKYQFNRIESRIENNRDVGTYYMRRRNNYYITAYNEEGSGVERAVPYGGMYEKQSSVNTNHVIRGSLNLYKKFGEDHTLSGVAGMEASENTYVFNQQTFVGWDDRTGTYDPLFDQNQFQPYGSISSSILGGSFSSNNTFIPEILSRSISSFSNLGYSYKAKYNIEGSAKVDQATAFGINKRLSKNLYWALSGSWNIAKEEFFGVDWVDALKLRASLGRNGNLRRGQTTATTIAYGSSDTYTGKPDASVDSWGNPNLAPEETTTLNFGLDFTIFNRVAAAIDVYDKQSHDLMVNQNTNLTYGIGTVYTNEGEISNKGIEFNLKADVIKAGDFTWKTDFNLSYNKNEVLKYGNRDKTNAISYYYDVSDGRTKLIGEDLSSEVRFKWAGLNANGDPQIELRDGSVITYTDDAFANIDQDEMMATKPFIAPTFGGFNNIFKYKNWTFNAYMVFKFGHVFQENLEAKIAQVPNSYDYIQARHKDIATAWQQPGDENHTDIPAMARDASEFNSSNRRYMFNMSDYALHNAAYVRLKDVTLWYDVDKKWVQKIGFDRASLMFQARDLGLIWKANDVGLDPESVPFAGRAITFAGSFPQAYRPGIKTPVSFVVGAKFEF